MNGTLYNEVYAWVRRNAREIDLCVWRALFEGGDPAAVADALLPYQNADGGFGNALEADNWNPASTPYTTFHALSQMNLVGYRDQTHPVFLGAVRYFNSGANLTEQGWRFTVPGTDAYPHAPWWAYNEADNATENIGLTAAIASVVLSLREPFAPIYERAVALSKVMAQRIEDERSLGEMGLAGLLALLPAMQAAGVEGPDYARLGERLHKRVNDSIVRDPAQWPTYGVRPSNYIRSPESPFYAENADIVAKELDYLLETREPGGVWPISWQWYGLMEQYAREFAISENWWKSVKAMENLAFLRAFGKA